MKIGILTYHRTLNYGACLQAVATRVALQKMGHEAYYVDYWPKYHSEQYKAFSIGRFFSLGLRSRLYYLVESIKWYKYRKTIIDNYELFFKEYIYPYCKPVDEEFDCIIYGSDQIWRKQDALKGYNPVYFAENDLKAKKHIAYSASMGILPQKEKDRLKIKDLVQNFNSIAVRERNLKELLASLGIEDVKLTIDPTLLLSSCEWNNVIPTTEENNAKYVLIYGISSVAFNLDYINEFAKAHNCQIKVLSGTASSLDTDELITTANPSKFISLIRNAEYIFTSSFHGLAFSIIYHKEFFASYSTNSNRAETLLESAGISGRLLPPSSIIPNDIKKIDYSSVDLNLSKLREASLNYLKDAIYD